jgi:DNA-binding LytR/AlgR family response regulator
MNQNIRSLQSGIHIHLADKKTPGIHLAPVIPINKVVTPSTSAHRRPEVHPSRIAVKTNDAVHLIKVDEIIRCLADDNYCTIYYGKGLKVMVARTLKAVGDLLPANGFLRVHNSHIVRLDMIHLVYPDHIVLYNGDNIPLSRITKKDLLIRLASIVNFL